ncbi:type II secretion system F family protein [Lacticaseibacillus saniviri]
MTKLSLKQQALACELLAMLLESGFTLDAALTQLQVHLPQQQARWQMMKQQLAQGADVAQAFAVAEFAPLVLSQLQLALIHGQLHYSLQTIATYLTQQVASRQKMMQLLIYPAILLGLLTVIQIGVIGVVKPLLTGQAFSFNVMLPVSLVVVIGLIGFLVRHYRQHRLAWQGGLLKWPIVGPLLRYYYHYQFALGAYAFSLAGQDLARYCQALGQLRQNMLAKVGQTVSQRLASGASLVQALDQPLIPADVGLLIQLGQPPAQFQLALAILSQRLFKQLTQYLERLIALVQPLLFLVIGVQIVLVYWQVLQPVYQLMEEIA